MTPTESTTPNSPNQPSSESKGDNKPKEAEPKTDPSTAEALRHTVATSDDITDPSTAKHLRETT
jgi:hypothetical protein